jgi:hypothetical protein
MDTMMVQLSFADLMVRDEQARMSAIASQIQDLADLEQGPVDYEELDYYEERTRWACEDIFGAWFAYQLAYDDRLWS